PPPKDSEFRPFHEVLHMLGFVDRSAPNHDFFHPHHVADDPTDLMWGGDRWNPGVLDVGHDDYFGENVPEGVRNLADSPFLGG
ncbi:MAG: hypothetical protein ACE5HQ_14115, partial [Gemmatimonadota bacterium]